VPPESFVKEPGENAGCVYPVCNFLLGFKEYLTRRTQIFQSAVLIATFNA
jgi:hypothetical protein